MPLESKLQLARCSEDVNRRIILHDVSGLSEGKVKPPIHINPIVNSYWVFKAWPACMSSYDFMTSNGGAEVHATLCIQWQLLSSSLLGSPSLGHHCNIQCWSTFGPRGAGLTIPPPSWGLPNRRQRYGAPPPPLWSPYDPLWSEEMSRLI